MNPRQAREVLEARRAELIGAYEAGTTLRDLARSTGASSETVRRYLIAHGVAIRDTHRRSRKIFEVRGAELIAAYEAGMPLSVLAENAGVSTPTLGKFLVARGDGSATTTDGTTGDGTSTGEVDW